MSTSWPCAGEQRQTFTPPRSVRDAMLIGPKTCDAGTTVGQAGEMFRDDHVHSLLVVRARRLLAVVEREDLRGRGHGLSAVRVGRLHGRVVAPDERLDVIFAMMVGRSVRRLAVTNDDDTLLGLLCLKQSQRGFCSDADVRSRAEAGLSTLAAS